MNEITAGKFVYVGRKYCGCAVGVITDYGDRPTAQRVAGFIEDGLTVNRVAWPAYQLIAQEETFMECPHGQLRLPLRAVETKERYENNTKDAG